MIYLFSGRPGFGINKGSRNQAIIDRSVGNRCLFNPTLLSTVKNVIFSVVCTPPDKEQVMIGNERASGQDMVVNIEEYRARIHDLNERVKELDCLYGISKIVERRETPIEDILQGVVRQIPASWQYPEITCARIVLDYQEYRSAQFRETRWCQAADIFVNGEKRGIVEVYYREQRPDSDEGPFLKEERNLLNVIAERLGNIVAQKNAEQKINQIQQELVVKAQRLEESNTALKVLLEHQDTERQKTETDILQKLKVLVLPFLEKMKTATTDDSQIVYINIIERNIQDITRHFRPGAKEYITVLSPVEQQVANLICDNRSTKDVARVLNMSENTVFFYRKSIRKKLDLQGEHINLKTHLQSLLSPQRTHG
jgi:DNA-binding CsgD family transcriptional regulator